MTERKLVQLDERRCVLQRVEAHRKRERTEQSTTYTTETNRWRDVPGKLVRSWRRVIAEGLRLAAEEIDA